MSEYANSRYLYEAKVGRPTASTIDKSIKKWNDLEEIGDSKLWFKNSNLSGRLSLASQKISHSHIKE